MKKNKEGGEGDEEKRDGVRRGRGRGRGRKRGRPRGGKEPYLLNAEQKPKKIMNNDKNSI